MDEGTDALEDGEILELCDTSSAADQFCLSRATREPQTICSEESSNNNSDDSDDDSDTQCSKPKKVKPQPQLPVNRNQVPDKYKVWSVALQEETLMENLTKCDVEAIDRERSVESYNYKLVDKTDYSQYSSYHMPVSECNFIDSDYVNCHDGRQNMVGSKRRHTDIKKRLGHKNDDVHHRGLPHLSVTTEHSEEEVAKDIAWKLKESKVDLILNVVLVLGKEKAIALYNETKGVEDNGGMLLMNGERRRTAGGVYLLLLKRDDSIASDAMKDIFADDANICKRKKRKAVKKQRNKKTAEIKETLIREKLLSLNTTTKLEAKSDLPLETECSNLEEGEVTVTNPPPSPATDQDTPPSRTLGGYSEDETEADNTHGATQPDNLVRKIVTYDDDDDDFLDVEVDDMDLF